MLLLDLADVLGVRAARRMPHIPQLERRIARSEFPPTQISGCGDGRGSEVASWNDQYSPSKSRSPSQSARSRRIASSARRPRPSNGMPHEVVLILVPAHPDAEREAAAGELLQRRDLRR